MSTPKQLFIDVSRWQGQTGMGAKKWRQLKKCGVRAAIIKASQGTGWVDPAAETNSQRARSVGMEVGFYHFMDGQPGQRQAQHFIRTVKAANRGKDARGRPRKGTLRDVVLVADVERNPGSGGNASGADVRAFLREVRRLAPKNRLLVYTAQGYWSAIGNPDVRELVNGLWQARWDGKRHTCEKRQLPAEPPRAGFGGWKAPRWWQFGALKGAHGSLDGNAYFGTEKRFRSLFRTVSPKPDEPEPDPIPDPEPPPTPDESATFRDGYNAYVVAVLEAIEKHAAIESGPGRFNEGFSEAMADIPDVLAAMRIEGET